MCMINFLRIKGVISMKEKWSVGKVCLFQFFIVGCIINFSACSEFVEYPLEKKQVSILAPSDGYNTTDSLLTFWWTTHQDAKYYRIQIVKPDFINTDILVIDSLVNTDRLTVKLDTGNYSWRVRPENDGSVGIYIDRTFRISAP